MAESPCGHQPALVINEDTLSEAEMEKFKTMALVFGGFAAGMAYTVACNGGKETGIIDTAQAAATTDSTPRCTAWEYSDWQPAEDGNCDTSSGFSVPLLLEGDSCDIPDDWEPFGQGGSYADVLVRRCKSYE